MFNFSFFSGIIIAGPWFVEIDPKKFCYHGNMTWKFLLSISSTTNGKVGKRTHEPKAQMARAYSGFRSMKNN